MAKGTKIWNTQELTIAYYIAKWGLYGLQDMTEQELVDHIIPDTTVGSLRMQVANFRHVLGLQDRILKDASKAMYELHAQIKNHTISQVRSSILPMLYEVDLNRSREKANNLKIRQVRNEKQMREDAAIKKRLKQLSINIHLKNQ